MFFRLFRQMRHYVKVCCSLTFIEWLQGVSKAIAPLQKFIIAPSMKDKGGYWNTLFWPPLHPSVRHPSALQIHVLTGDMDCLQTACLSLRYTTKCMRPIRDWQLPELYFSNISNLQVYCLLIYNDSQSSKIRTPDNKNVGPQMALLIFFENKNMG